MKKIYCVAFVLSSLFLLSCDSENAQKAIKETETFELSELSQDIKNDYSPQLILIAIEHVTASHMLKDAMEQMDHARYFTDAEKLISKSPNLVDSLLSDIQTRGDGIVTKHIYNWCHIFTTMHSAEYFDAPVFLDEVLNEIPISKRLIDLTLTKQQLDYRSLSSTQVNELPYQVSTYLAGEKEEMMTSFLQSFYISVNKRVHQRFRTEVIDVD